MVTAEAVKSMVFGEHTAVGLVTVIVGKAFTVTLVAADIAEHPLALVTVTL